MPCFLLWISGKPQLHFYRKCNRFFFYSIENLLKNSARASSVCAVHNICENQIFVCSSLVQKSFSTDKHATLLRTPRAPQVQSRGAHDPVRAGNVCPHSHPHPLWSINFLMVRLVHPKPHCSSGRGWVAETEMWWGCEGECLDTRHIFFI